MLTIRELTCGTKSKADPRGYFCFLLGISRVCPATKSSLFGLTLDIKLGQITHMYFKDYLSQQQFKIPLIYVVAI